MPRTSHPRKRRALPMLDTLEINPPATLSPLDRGANPEAVLPTVAIVGLGYVGLPVAVEFGKRRPTIGYDLSKKRIESLKHFVDATGEVSAASLMEAKQLRATAYPGELEQADFIIVAVPTPINEARQPDFGPLV